MTTQPKGPEASPIVITIRGDAVVSSPDPTIKIVKQGG